MGFQTKLTKAQIEFIIPRAKGVPPIVFRKGLNAGMKTARFSIS